MAGPLVSVLPVPAVVALLGGACLLGAVLASGPAHRESTARAASPTPVEQPQRSNGAWDLVLDMPTAPLYPSGMFRRDYTMVGPVATRDRVPIGAGRTQ